MGTRSSTYLCLPCGRWDTSSSDSSQAQWSLWKASAPPLLKAKSHRKWECRAVPGTSPFLLEVSVMSPGGRYHSVHGTGGSCAGHCTGQGPR